MSTTDPQGVPREVARDTAANPTREHATPRPAEPVK